MYHSYTKSLPGIKQLFVLLFIASGFNSIAQSNIWVQKSDLGYNTANVAEPSARENAVGFSIGSKGYIGTGYYVESETLYKDFWEYDPVANTWTQKADFGGTARCSAVGFSIGGKGYVGTGAGFDNGYINYKDFWEYDPVANTWIQKEDFGGAVREGAVGFSLGNKAYIGTGWADEGTSGNFYRDFWEFDPALNAWTQKEDFGGTTRVYAVGFSILNKGYLGTGYLYDGEDNYYKDFWEFDPALNVWVQKADFAGTARYLATGFGLDSKGYLGAGDDDNERKKDFWEYDPGLDTWVQKADFGGTVRKGAACFSLGSKGYMGTGYNSADYKDFWEFDPVLNTWTQKADFGGTARYHAVSFSIGNRGYIGTGVNYPDFYRDFWEYDPALDAWTQKADFGGAERYLAVGFSIGNKGYIGTGRKYDNGYINLKDFWEFDPALNTWTQKADFGGTARYNAVGFSIGGKGYLGTGYDWEFRKDFWEYDPAIDTWIQKSDFGGNVRYAAVAFSIYNKGYIGTGVSSTGYLKDFWEYNPDINTWTQKSDFVGGFRFGAVGFSLGNKGYLGTGLDINEAYKKDFWEYSPAVDTWTQKTDFAGTARDKAVAFSIGNKGYLGTGWSEGYKKDFWEYTPDVCVGITVYADVDDDGYGDISSSFFASDCILPEGYVTDSTDCNDTNPTIFPGAQEILFNSIDDNCNGYIDEFGTGIEEINSTSFFTISPNPANIQTTIQFTLPHSSQVCVSIFDLSGKKIMTLIDEELQQGDHSLQINTAQFSKGIYLVKMITNGGIENQKLIIQ